MFPPARRLARFSAPLALLSGEGRALLAARSASTPFGAAAATGVSDVVPSTGRSRTRRRGPRHPRAVAVAGTADKTGRSVETEALTAQDEETRTEWSIGDAADFIEREDGAVADDDAAAEEKDAAGMVCRIVASSDGKLPASRSTLPPSVFSAEGGGGLLEKIDAIFHAETRAETRTLEYLDGKPSRRGDDDDGENGKTVDAGGRDAEEEEGRLVSVLRSALDDAGFELLSRRDLELCEALNVGYLLRLSIAPNLKDLDPSVGRRFYPGPFPAEDAEGGDGGAASGALGDGGENPLLFDGRVLVFRRGYSEEVTEGRLLLPKLDYLQATLVQRSAAAVAGPLVSLERKIETEASKSLGSIRSYLKSKLAAFANSIKVRPLADFFKSKWGWKDDTREERLLGSYGLEREEKSGGKENGKSVFRLSRYAGSKKQFVGSPDIRDALNPFLVCEVGCGAVGNGLPAVNLDESINHDIYTEINRGHITCEYDRSEEGRAGSEAPKQLLQRVSVSNLVDFFSAEGRKGLVRRFFSKSELVEPTYEEVVVIWRALPKKRKKRKLPAPPNVVYKGAEIFGVDDRLPEKPKKLSRRNTPLEIRAFTDVPMANLLAVLPKTKLIFRPADAFVFDSVSLVSLLAVLGSQRYDSPRLDLLALVSVFLWILRTFFRYSNKLARYDLLVNKFLTSKISHRGPGALKYITTEAGSQRAVRASLTHKWLVNTETAIDPFGNSTGLLGREEILRGGMNGVNGMIGGDRRSRVNIAAALDDLEELGLVSFSRDGSKVKEIQTGSIAMGSLKDKWEALFNQ